MLLLNSQTAVSRRPPNIAVHMVAIPDSFGRFGFKSCVNLASTVSPLEINLILSVCVLLSRKKRTVQKTF